MTTMTTTPASRRPRITVRQWSALAVLVLPVLLISIDMTVLGFAVPFLSQSLSPSAGQLLWIIDVYGFVLAGLLVTMGSLGDRIGRRKLLIVGVAAFAAASLLAAYAPSTEALISARVLLGVAGATLMPSTLAMLRQVFTDERQRLFAIAVWGAGFSVGAAAGPILGGLLLEHFWWGSVFLMAVPVTLVVLVSAPFLLRESRDPEPGPLDWASVGLSFITMLPFVYGVKTIAAHGFSTVAVVSLLIGVSAGYAFIARQRRLTYPLIDVGLLRLRRFSASIATNFIVVFSLIAALFFLTQYLQLVVGLSPVRAGMVLVPGLTLSVITGLVAVRLSDRFGLATIIVTGLLLLSTGYVVLTLIGAGTGAVLVGGAFAVIGIGSGLVQTVTNAAIMTAAPPDRAGAAAAISETAYELGGALGVAVLGSVAAGIYGNQLADAPAAARETLGGAIDVAAGMSTSAAAALVDAARDAFTTGLRATSVIAAVLLVVAAVAVGRTLRDRVRA